MSSGKFRLRPACALMLGILVARSACAQSSSGAGQHAESGATASLADSLTGTAKADYTAARILYDDGDFRGALQKLKIAYDTSKDPRLLWDMAACEKNLRHYAEVLRLVDRYLTEGGTAVTERDRAEATELASTVRSFVTDLTVEADQPGATVLFDERPLGTTPLPGPVRVDMGQHKIRITKTGFVDFTASPELVGGQSFHLSAALVTERHEGRLRILADPADVITVDQHTVGTGLWEGKVSSGTHAVYVAAKGKRSHSTDVVVQDGNTSTLHVSLDDEPKNVALEKGGIPTWVWVAGGAALVAGGVGAYFALKPDNGTRYQAASQGSWGMIPF
jgi:hypothetical protein